MSGYPVVVIDSGGLPVTYAASGWPVAQSAAGFPVTLVSSGGLPIVEGGNASEYAPSPAPEGFHWEFVYVDWILITQDGVPVVELVGN